MLLPCDHADQFSTIYRDLYTWISFHSDKMADIWQDNSDSWRKTTAAVIVMYFDDVQNAICILKLGINDGNFSTFVCLFLECLEWVVCSCWFLLVLFASLFVHTHAPQQVYLCLVLLTVRLISCISDMLGLIGLVMGYCVTLCNVLWIMHCVSLAILSQWSRFHPPTVGTNWPIQCWHAVKHQTNKCY